MNESQHARRRRLGPTDQWALDQMRANSQPKVPDKGHLRLEAVSMFLQALDAKLDEMEEGDSLGVLFNIQIIKAPSRGRPENYQWRKAVLNRDGHRCQQCGATERLHAHHVKEWAKYPDLRFDVDNGLTLCEDCHTEKHPYLPLYQQRRKK